MIVPTPYSLLNDPDDPRDVFEEIFPQYVDPDDPSLGERPFWAEKRAALWARFHDTGIGNDDADYWIRCMKGRAAEIETEYDMKFRVFDEYKTRFDTAASVDLSDGRVESESVNRIYDPPEVTVAGSKAEDYLSDQNRTDFAQRTFGGLEPETVRAYTDAIRDPHEDYAREFDRLFYWGL